MSEYAYRIEYDSAPMVDRIAAQIQHKVDQAALDKAADTLAEFGYLKVVRCRDCVYFDTRKCKSQWPFCLDAFCWWGKRKEGGDDR